MSSHPVRNAVLVLLAVVVSAIIIYGLYLYNLSLNLAGGTNPPTFKELLQSDLKYKFSQLNQGSKR